MEIASCGAGSLYTDKGSGWQEDGEEERTNLTPAHNWENGDLFNHSMDKVHQDRGSKYNILFQYTSFRTLSVGLVALTQTGHGSTDLLPFPIWNCVF